MPCVSCLTSRGVLLFIVGVDTLYSGNRLCQLFTVVELWCITFLFAGKYKVHFSFSVEEIMVARSMTRTENITGNFQGNKWAR
jgi:hypothetical protein